MTMLFTKDNKRCELKNPATVYPRGSLIRSSYIVRVIFNKPATVVFWNDGTKTVVKCRKNDFFDPEKGLAMAIAKKAMGNTNAYYKAFKKPLADYCDGLETFDQMMNRLYHILNQ